MAPMSTECGQHPISGPLYCWLSANISRTESRGSKRCVGNLRSKKNHLLVVLGEIPRANSKAACEFRSQIHPGASLTESQEKPTPCQWGEIIHNQLFNATLRCCREHRLAPDATGQGVTMWSVLESG
eukprot:551662-Rhodomonas_salina.1